MRVIQEATEPQVTRELMKERGAWYDDDGDLNLVIDNHGEPTVIYFGRHHGTIFSRGTLEEYDITDVSKILAPGTRITLEV